MGKQKISGKELAGDIRSGMPDRDLIKKYGLSQESLQKAFDKLTSVGLLSREDVQKRSGSPIPKPQDFVKCPSCGLPQPRRLVECPNCGVIMSKARDHDSRKAAGEQGELGHRIERASCPQCGCALDNESTDCPRCGVVLSRVTATSVPRDGSRRQQSVNREVGRQKTENRSQAEIGIQEYSEEEQQIGAVQSRMSSSGKLMHYLSRHKIITISVSLLLALFLIGLVVETVFKGGKIRTYKQALKEYQNNQSRSSKADFEASLERLKKVIVVAAGTVKGTRWSEDEVDFMVFSALDEIEKFAAEIRPFEEKQENIYDHNAAEIRQLLYGGFGKMVTSIGNPKAKARVQFGLAVRGYSGFGQPPLKPVKK